MSNPNPKNQLKPGQTHNKAGINQYSSRPKELIAFIRDECLAMAPQLIIKLREMALGDDPKVAFMCIKELLDRGLGKSIQSVTLDSSTGQPLSAQQTLDIVDKALKQQEEHEAMAKRILELEEQIKWLNNKPVADVAIVAVAETPKE